MGDIGGEPGIRLCHERYRRRLVRTDRRNPFRIQEDRERTNALIPNGDGVGRARLESIRQRSGNRLVQRAAAAGGKTDGEQSEGRRSHGFGDGWEERRDYGSVVETIVYALGTNEIKTESNASGFKSRRSRVGRSRPPADAPVSCKPSLDRSQERMQKTRELNSPACVRALSSGPY